MVCSNNISLVHHSVYDLGLVTRREAIASPSIGFTLSRVSTVFTRSAITTLEVNRSGWNLGHSEYIVWSWPWQILGAIRAEARAGAPERGPIFCFFCQVNNERLYRFPVGQISWNLHTRRGSVRWWILLEQNFENFPIRGWFFQKTNFWPKFPTTCDFMPL